MRYTFVSSLSHYTDHLAPLWFGLPEDYRGEFIGRAGGHERAHELGIPAVMRKYPKRGLMVVAGYQDLRKVSPAPAVLVNHGAGQTYCLGEMTRILTADFQWKHLRDIRLDDELVGFEEFPTDRKWRQWKPAKVVGIQRVIRPCYELSLEDGTKLLSSAEHRWLKTMNETQGWLATEKFRSGEKSPKLVKPFEPWEVDASRGAGYLAAAFDGEGSLTQTSREPRQNRLMLTFTQKPNAMLDVVCALLKERNFQFSVSRPSKDSGCVHLSVLGGLPEVTRFLGSIRPHRLLRNLRPFVNGQMRGKTVKVLDTKFVGEREVIGLTTSTGTFFAEGFASHNSADPASARHPSFSGGEDRDNVVMHICPSRHDAELNWAAGTAQVVAAGPCKLDPWLSGRRTRRVDGSIAISFHADAYVCPESQSAFPHYRKALIELAKHPEYRTRLVGHCHPRSRAAMSAFWRSIGVRFEPDFAKILDHAAAYVCDSSSTLYEAAAVGIPVVVLDAPWYRVEVEHGLRFWSEADVGVRIQDPEQMGAAIDLALLDHYRTRKRRLDTVARVYDGGVLDGHATDRAVAAMMAMADGWS